MKEKEYRIHWWGWEGGRGFSVQIKRRWWIFSWWQDVAYFENLMDADNFYKMITNETTIN